MPPSHVLALVNAGYRRQHHLNNARRTENLGSANGSADVPEGRSITLEAPFPLFVTPTPAGNPCVVLLEIWQRGN